MGENYIYSIVGLAITVLVHFGGSIWWASKLTMLTSHILLELEKINKEFEKRDNELKALWNKVDHIEYWAIKQSNGYEPQQR